MAEKLIAPYLEWAVQTNFIYLRGPDLQGPDLHGEWFRVLLELDEAAAKFAQRVKGLENLIRLPPIYSTDLSGFDGMELHFCSGVMSKEGLRLLVFEAHDSGLAAEFATVKQAIKRIELGPPVNTGVFADTPAPILHSGVGSAPTSIVAVIDDGLAFANERFRVNGKTRFKYFWNQDDTTSVNPPPGFGWGRELSEKNINDLLHDHTHSDLVDEDALYREAGQQLVARRIKHGTHVMDIAGGPDPKDATYQPPYLIGVQLPRWVTAESSGMVLTPAVYEAINYIVNRADQIAAGTSFQIVVNISYGTIAGPHDGTGVFEAAIDQLIAGRSTPLRVVLPAGNHFLARCHAGFDLPAATAAEKPVQKLHWRIQPDDKANSFVEIWLPKLAPDGTRPSVSVQLTNPMGKATGWVMPGHQYPPLPPPYPPPPPPYPQFLVQSFDPAGERPSIVLAVAATAAPTSSDYTAPSGTWIIEIRNEAAEVAIDAWVQRGDTPFGFPLWGRQSRFDDENYKRFDLAGYPWQEDNDGSYIHRFGSLNALATGQYSIVVGGFRRNESTPSEYSGAGPVATPGRTGPDASAVADDSKVLSGVLAAGTRSRSTVDMLGTSIAAPQVTRLVAEWMAKGLPSDRAAVQDFARSREQYPPPHGSPLEERLGEGRINQAEPVALRLKDR
jgi:hypothetical protein